MIQINILKARAQKWKMRQMLVRLSFFYLAGLFLLLFFIWVRVMVEDIYLARLERDIISIKQKLVTEQSLMATLQKYKEYLTKAASDLSLCEKEAASRVFWAGKMSVVASALPAGVWLGTLTTKEETGDKRKEKEIVFLIKGFVSPDGNGKQAIVSFIQNLLQSGVGEFSKVTLKDVKRESSKDEEKISFTVECGLLKKAE